MGSPKESDHTEDVEAGTEAAVFSPEVDANVSCPVSTPPLSARRIPPPPSAKAGPP